MEYRRVLDVEDEDVEGRGGEKDVEGQVEFEVVSIVLFRGYPNSPGP